MHLPGRLRITWEDDSTLKLDADAGTQTRVFRFHRGQTRSPGLTPQTPSQAGRVTRPRSGNSTAADAGAAACGPGRGRPARVAESGDDPAAAGLLPEERDSLQRKRRADEDFKTLTDSGIDYLVVTNFLEDPQYLAQPYVRSVQFKRQPDAKGWNPTACSAR